MRQVLNRPSRGEATRTRLLDLAESAILSKGYAATSIEELIAAAGITKSGFFYHFAEKTDLAKALLRRDNERTQHAYETAYAAADAIHADPLDAFIAALGMVSDMLTTSTGALPGCLVAAFSYQEAHFDAEQRGLLHTALAVRHAQLRGRLEAITALHQPRAGIDLGDLADMAIAVIQGGIILDRVRVSPDIVRQQITLYQAFVRAVFTGVGQPDESRAA